MTSCLPFARIPAMLQLASPLLPVGAYAYSQGIERAVHDRTILDADDAQRWIVDSLVGPIAYFEAPVFVRLHRAVCDVDRDRFAEWDERFLTSRETRELREETLQMGASLQTLARGLSLPIQIHDVGSLTFPAAFAAFANALGLDERESLAAYLWGWLENQVTAALKAVPLGQLAGQRLLLEAHETLGVVIATASKLDDDDLVSAAPGLALASALHEIQYSRLFRS
ncbi:MAG TPA: urease accessory UreF family protein [Casimicrobiaceae bacterium]|nr:urease accessory UreF family protein [Casimicrobiaceae bacterium]